MPVTLRSMLTMNAVAGGRPEVLAGDDALDRPVRWVHVAEVADVADLLGGHEVVLTTGLPLTGPGADARRFVQQLSRADACGLVVELGPETPALPADLVAEAESLHLPLVVLHAPVRFVSITEAVHRLIVGEQYLGLEFAQRTHEVFTDLSLDSADAPAILAEAANLVDAPLVLEDAGHRVVALAQHGRSPGELLDGWEERSRRSPVRDDAGRSGPEEWLTCPVGLRGSPWGRIVAPEPAADPAGAAMVLQRAAQALQISRLVERDTTRLQFQAQESLLQELMEARSTESDASARARALGMRPAAGYLPVVALFEPSAVADQIARQRRARSHLELVSTALDEASVSAIAGGIGDRRVGIVVALRSTSDEDTALQSISAALTRRAGPSRAAPVLGVGRSTGTLTLAGSLLGPTAHVAEAAQALPSRTLPWFRSTDVRLRGLVAQLQDDERLLRFAESELGPLLAHDAEHRTDLLGLLREHVRLRGNKSALAQSSHVSRQALYGRLRRLEAILAVDLDDPDSMLSLGVALLVHDIRSPAPSSRG